MEELHPEQYSESARLALRKSIHAAYSRSRLDLYELARSLLDLRPSDNVLDIGCGFGEFLIQLSLSGHLGKLHGVDRSAELIEAARNDALGKSCAADFRMGDAMHLDFPSASFDCITALNVLGEVEPPQILAEIGRVLVADGRVVVSANSRSSYPLLGELKKRARERFGWFLASEWQEGFDRENAGEILRKYFTEAEEFRYEDVLQYPDAEVLVGFFRSTRGLWNDRISDPEWNRIVDWARDQALEFIPEHGYAEDPVSVSLFRCTAPLGL